MDTKAQDKGSLKMTPSRLQELKKLCDEAAPGPWGYRSCYGVATIEDKELQAIAHAVDYLKPNNAEFIAVARTALPELIAEVERLRSELEHETNRCSVCHCKKGYCSCR